MDSPERKKIRVHLDVSLEADVLPEDEGRTMNALCAAGAFLMDTAIKQLLLRWPVRVAVGFREEEKRGEEWVGYRGPRV